MRLTGGPHDGREVSAWPRCVVAVPVAIPPSRMAGPDDMFDVDTFRFLDDELNVRFVMHRYDGRSGKYLGDTLDM